MVSGLSGFFDGEEYSRFLRMWTHGYDVYTPHRPVVFHDYRSSASLVRPCLLFFHLRPLLYQITTLSDHYSIRPLLYQTTTLSDHYSIRPLLYQTTTLSDHYSISLPSLFATHAHIFMHKYTRTQLFQSISFLVLHQSVNLPTQPGCALGTA